MLARSKQQFIDYFNEIDDPRQDEKVLYPLHEVLFLVLVGVLGCGRRLGGNNCFWRSEAKHTKIIFFL